MKLRWGWPPWGEPTPSEETIEAEKRLHQVRRDDAKINAQTRRTDRLRTGNGFAQDVAKALRAGQ